MNELLDRQFDCRPKIAVVGDSMLDEYYEVSAERLSPEFPIPVLLSTDGEPFKVALGGAANVCAQFKNFNFDVELFSLSNERIKEILDERFNADISIDEVNELMLQIGSVIKEVLSYEVLARTPDNPIDPNLN